LLSLVTVPTSVAAAASTTLYRQLYSAEGNDHKGEQLYSDGDEDEDNDDDHVFQLQDTLRLRIVEEANLLRVKIKVMRSDIENLIVAGYHFMFLHITRRRLVGRLYKRVAVRETTFS
jgi:hypothetical protein